MDSRLSVVTLGVADLDASIAFYEDLGFERMEWDGEVAFFDAGGLTLSLFPREALAADAGVPADGTGFRGVTLAQTVDDAADVEAALADAEAAGGEVVKPAADTDWGGHSGYFADPDGHLWEVVVDPFA